jgi:glycerophosphoryl diester phosphodiesterase
MQPTLIGHRGASSLRAENTLAAFTSAADLGDHAIELDVHATADGELVVHHDYLLDRTTSGTGLIHQQPWAYVRELDAGLVVLGSRRRRTSPATIGRLGRARA